MAKCMIKIKFNSVDGELNTCRLHVGIKEIGLQRIFFIQKMGVGDTNIL